jgi:hypothetical protein
MLGGWRREEPLSGRARIVVCGVVAMGALIAPAAAGGAGFEFRVRLTSATPGSPTGIALHEVFPNGADGRPKQVRHGVYRVAARFHHDAMPVCDASDTDFSVAGLDACPPRTALGSGTATAITGFGPPLDPLETDIHMFHGRGEELYVYTPPGASRPVYAVARARVRGSTIVDDPTYPPGFPPPDGKSAIRRLDVRYAPASPGYITTPATCPRAGRWMSHVDLSYTDGSSDSADSHTPCHPSARPIMHLAVTPRTVEAGESVVFRFRLESASTRCRRGVAVSFAGATVHTGERGRAQIRRTLHRPGRHRATATATGCRAARSVVTALPAERRTDS